VPASEVVASVIETVARPNPARAPMSVGARRQGVPGLSLASRASAMTPSPFFTIAIPTKNRTDGSAMPSQRARADVHGVEVIVCGQ
jgi:hypothetical protein